MRYLILILILTSCSLSKNSTYWNEDLIKKSALDKELSKLIQKSADIISLSVDEYEIYIADYTKKSKYPEINN